MERDFTDYAKEYPLTILYAEDNRLDQIIMEKYLGYMGYSVELCQSVDSVLPCVTSTVYDLIFMDLKMPGNDGFEIASRIRVLEKSMNRHSALIVAITGYADSWQRNNVMECGMDDYYEKPVGISDLARIVENAFIHKAQPLVR